jgi:NAD(P)-dependent dehydrogenase (short-subunit alcohol dehydrogenase family)
LAGTFRLIQAVLAGMRRAGGGNIVIMASEWGVTGYQWTPTMRK